MNQSTVCSLGMSTWEYEKIGLPISLINLNRSTVSFVKGIITTIKQLVFVRNMCVCVCVLACLIEELGT